MEESYFSVVTSNGHFHFFKLWTYLYNGQVFKDNKVNLKNVWYRNNTVAQFNIVNWLEFIFYYWNFHYNLVEGQIYRQKQSGWGEQLDDLELRISLETLRYFISFCCHCKVLPHIRCTGSFYKKLYIDYFQICNGMKISHLFIKHESH